MRHYWFRPARFWKWFAAYYPVTWQGWLVSIMCATALLKIFSIINATSLSASDTVLNMTPWALIVFLIFDLITLRTGEYPSWWKKWHASASR